jgi:23S rRNA-/tRNA-specific pseudouridylate synthase
MEIKILYKDEFVLGLNKPSGLMVHSDGRREELTLVDWINQNYPDLSEVGEQQILQNGEKIKRPGSRLD